MIQFLAIAMYFTDLHNSYYSFLMSNEASYSLQFTQEEWKMN